MKYFYSTSIYTRSIILLTAVFLIYGYLCRLMNIYFFWESKTIGWILFITMIIVLLLERINIKKVKKKKAILEKIGVGLSCFILLIKGILFFVTPQTSAYNKAIAFIKENHQIAESVGQVKGVSIIPFGGMSMSTSSEGESGQADLHFIVKGTKRYIDLNLLMSKDFGSDWQIQINDNN